MKKTLSEPILKKNIYNKVINKKNDYDVLYQRYETLNMDLRSINVATLKSSPQS